MPPPMTSTSKSVVGQPAQRVGAIEGSGGMPVIVASSATGAAVTTRRCTADAAGDVPVNNRLQISIGRLR